MGAEGAIFGWSAGAIFGTLNLPASPYNHSTRRRVSSSYPILYFLFITRPRFYPIVTPIYCLRSISILLIIHCYINLIRNNGSPTT